MRFNIKDPEAVRLAQAISRATGETMASVVKEALRERYAKIEHQKGKASLEQLLAIADRAAARLNRPTPIMPSFSTTKTACRNELSIITL